VAHARDVARTYGKSAPIDALAVVRERFANQTCRRHASTGQSGSCASSSITVRWHLHELDPNFEPPARSLWRKKHVRATEALLERHDSLVALSHASSSEGSASSARPSPNLTRRSRCGSQRSRQAFSRSIRGCGTLTAAKIVGEVAAVTRFRNKDAFARHNGTAPLPVWSGNRVRHRRARTGNRQLNASIHRIAITQAHYHPDARAYLERRRAGGDTKIASLSGLKWRLSDVVYRALGYANRNHTSLDAVPSGWWIPYLSGNELFVSGGGGTPVAMAQGLNAAAWIGCASRRGPDGRRTARPARSRLRSSSASPTDCARGAQPTSTTSCPSRRIDS
jgi:hypothetical protein